MAEQWFPDPRHCRRTGTGPTAPLPLLGTALFTYRRTVCWAAGRDLARAGDPEEQTVETDPVTGSKPDRAFKVLTWKNAAGEKTDWKLEFTPPAASPIKPVQIAVPPQLNRGLDLKVNLSLPQGMEVSSADSPYRINVSLTEDCNGIIRTIEKAAAADLTFLGADKNPAYELTFPTGRMRQLLGVVKVEVHEGDKLKADGAAEVIISPVYKAGESRWQDYEILMWPVGGLPFLQPLEDTMMKQFGSTGVMETRWHGLSQRMRWARAGLRLMVHDFARRQLQLSHGRFANLMADWNKTKNRDLLIRKPSYADSEFLEAEEKRVTDLIKMLKPFDPTNYITCDEPSLSSYSKDFDFDFHPENITRFRKYLEAKFKTVANFNAACNEKAASWDDIAPQITVDTKKDGRWGLWNEWRIHNDNVMADGYKLYKDLVESVDPNGTISISGTQLATPFDGFDWYKLSSHFGTMQGYGYAYQDNKRISFNPEMLNAVPAGYGRSGRAVDYQIWSKLCDHGGGHVLFWWIAFRNYDLTYCQSARDYQRLFAEMRGGIGKQYMQGRRKLSPVGILYSMNSMRAAYKDSGESRSYSGPEGKVTGALIDAGFDPQFVASQQVAAGELIAKGFKALVMPMPLALGYGDKPGGLSVKKGLEDFIEQGGKVFYTEAPKYDEFLQPRIPDPNFLARLVKWETVKDSLQAALTKAGAVPWVKISKPDGTPLKGTSVFTYKLQGETDAHIVTVLRTPVGTKEIVGGDGVVHSVPDKEGGNEIEPMLVDVSGFGRVTCYDMRAGKELKPDEAGKLSINMRAGDGYPIALLPYSVRNIGANATVKDRAITVNVQVQAETGVFAPHVIHIEVASAAGETRKFDPALTRNIVTDSTGKATIVLPLSLEQLGRDYTVAVIDRMSGKQEIKALPGQ
ncbi:hypothetical protein ACFL4W_02000 [Planctomycetota bacterium]